MTALIIALSVLLLCAAAFVYVLIRLLVAILSLDSAIAREIFALRSGKPPANYNIEAAMAAKPTEGAFEPTTDEEAAIYEIARRAKAEGMSDEEIAAFIKQGIGASTD